jgi:hypothetical protein
MLGATAYAVVPGLDLIHFQMQFFFNLPKEDRVRLIIMPSTPVPGTHAQWSVVSGQWSSTSYQGQFADRLT